MKTPKLLLDFTAILNIVPVDEITPSVATLFFTLFKLCKDSKVRTPLTTFAFNNINFSTSPNSQTLKFEYPPDDDICGDCCTYILELTSITSYEPTIIFDISINNALLSIIAVDP